MGPLDRYRATGADLPGQFPTRAHPGVAMEGYFGRVTDPATGRVLIALIGVNQGPDGPWATVGVASAEGYLHTGEVPGAFADPHVLAASTTGFSGSATHLRIDLADAHVDLALDPVSPWPNRLLGGSSVFQAVPRLNQYWHPWLLAGRATGTIRLGADEWSVAGAHVYGEKNWGAEGFPDSWWWGQAHGFAEPGATVAFAGGQVHARPLGLPLRSEVTALVVRLPGGRVLRLGDPGLTPVTADVGDGFWRLRGVDRLTGWRIAVDARDPVHRAHVLPVPLPSRNRNTPGALEHLDGELDVEVTRRGVRRPVWTGRTRVAGLERGGLDLAEGELARRGGDPRPAAR